MLSNVLIASMNKGQFPVALFALVVIVILIKMPSADVSKLAFRILDDLRTNYLIGYGLAVITLVVTLFITKWQRRRITIEMRRISDERTMLQTKLLDSDLGSSNK